MSRTENIVMAAAADADGKHIGTDFVKDEYLCLHETVQNYDNKLIAIKTWSVTLGMAGIGAGFLQNHSTVFLLSAAASVLFWTIDAMWRKYQIIYNYRILELEEFIARNDREIKAFQISSSFSYYNDQRTDGLFPSRKPIKAGRSFHVMLPHVLVVISGAFLWLWANGHLCPIIKLACNFTDFTIAGAYPNS
jgi:hypothetical protein